MKTRKTVSIFLTATIFVLLFTFNSFAFELDTSVFGYEPDAEVYDAAQKLAENDFPQDMFSLISEDSIKKLASVVGNNKIENMSIQEASYSPSKTSDMTVITFDITDTDNDKYIGKMVCVYTSYGKTLSLYPGEVMVNVGYSNKSFVKGEDGFYSENVYSGDAVVKTISSYTDLARAEQGMFSYYCESPMFKKTSGNFSMCLLAPANSERKAGDPGADIVVTSMQTEYVFNVLLTVLFLASLVTLTVVIIRNRKKKKSES
jgi:hypothetical protein